MQQQQNQLNEEDVLRHCAPLEIARLFLHFYPNKPLRLEYASLIVIGAASSRNIHGVKTFFLNKTPIVANWSYSQLGRGPLLLCLMYHGCEAIWRNIGFHFAQTTNLWKVFLCKQGHSADAAATVLYCVLLLGSYQHNFQYTQTMENANADDFSRLPVLCGNGEPAEYRF